MSITVTNILRNKSNEIFSVAAHATIFQALQLMAEKNVGALLVLDNNQVVGIMSERDYARKVILLGKSSHESKVQEIMSDKVFYVTPSRTAEECMAIMIQKHIRHLPVLENEKIVGVISIGDVVNAVIKDKEFEIEQLEDYIIGRNNSKLIHST